MRVLWFICGLTFWLTCYQIVSTDYMPPRGLVALAWFSVGLRMMAEAIPGRD